MADAQPTTTPPSSLDPTQVQIQVDLDYLRTQ